MTITIAGTVFDRHEPDAVEEAFYKNYLLRRLATVYGIPINQAINVQMQHVAHDLDSVRYRAWLMIRRNGVTLSDTVDLVTDDNVIDVFALVWATPQEQTVVQGAGADLIRQVIAEKDA